MNSKELEVEFEKDLNDLLCLQRDYSIDGCSDLGMKFLHEFNKFLEKWKPRIKEKK